MLYPASLPLRLALGLTLALPRFRPRSGTVPLRHRPAPPPPRSATAPALMTSLLQQPTMASVVPVADFSVDDPVMVEGLPGVGLVGKIATDHVIEQLDMDFVATVDCEGIPRVAIYNEDDTTVQPPVRLYADEANDVLALQSDIPVSRTAAREFAGCVTTWLEEHDALPLYLSGLPVQDLDPEKVPDLFGIATGDAAGILDDHAIPLPPERGVVGGPTGALLNRAGARDIDAVGLVVDSDPQFPDPAAARRLIEHGIEPIAEIDVGTEELVDRAEEIQDQKEVLAQRMQEAAEEESTQAKPLRMFQ